MGCVLGWLAGQLEANQYARLSEGGHAGGQIRLRQVFVDLPVQAQQEDLFLAGFIRTKLRPLETRGQVLPGSIDNDQASRAFHSQTIGISTRDFETHSLNLWQAVLLIGGPGQGKSTLAQIACQLHRVSLLQPIAAQLPTTQQELLASFKRSATEDNLPSPPEAALPLQVMLPDLAGWLSDPDKQDAANDASPILQFICLTLVIGSSRAY